jgi:hypothetical protein
MPSKFDFDLTYGILRCQLAGPVTDEVLREFFHVGARHARRTHPVGGVVDLSEVTSFEVSAETIGQIARTTPALTDPELKRIVIAPTPHLFGMMRMFATQGEESRPNLHVVRTEQEAWEILGVRNPQFNILDSE